MERPDLLEKQGVLFVGQRVTPFDHVDTHFRQSDSDIQFVL